MIYIYLATLATVEIEIRYFLLCGRVSFIPVISIDDMTRSSVSQEPRCILTALFLAQRIRYGAERKIGGFIATLKGPRYQKGGREKERVHQIFKSEKKIPQGPSLGASLIRKFGMQYTNNFKRL